MSKEGEFLIYCMERYRYYKNMSGAEVSKLFQQCGVFEYVIRNFGALHTTGELYLIDDLDGFIADQKLRKIGGAV